MDSIEKITAIRDKIMNSLNLLILSENNIESDCLLIALQTIRPTENWYKTFDVKSNSFFLFTNYRNWLTIPRFKRLPDLSEKIIDDLFKLLIF